jgi:hypothetical protein
MFKKRSSYHSTKKITYKGVVYDSNLELHFYKLLEINKLVDKVKTQVPFLLQESFKWQGKTIRKIEYIADFYFEDKKIVIEPKGLLEEKAKIKHKIFKYKYPNILFFLTRNQADNIEVIKKLKIIYGI